MVNWIQNIGAADAQDGNHFDCGENSMMIQISDPQTDKCFVTPWFPQLKRTYKEVHQFQFLEVEDGDTYSEELGISDAQAAELVRLLQHALEHRMNVVVHCFAGVCRSGAVAEIGIMLGFVDTEVYRQPNVRVKTKMMKCLGWSYN